MKPLVYTLCYGHSYLPVFATWLRALRDVGEYEGEVVVLTDLPAYHFAAARVGRLHCHQTKRWLALSVYYEKTSILELEDLDDYDAVLYLDADVVTVNPIAACFEACLASEGPLLNRSRHDMAWEFNAGLLDEAERERVRRDGISGINAGVFAATRGSLRPLVERWRVAIREHHARSNPIPRGGDQPFLNRMVLRGEVPGFQFLPEGWLRDWLPHVGWRTIRDIRSGQLKLVHLPGPEAPDRKAETMRRLARRARHASAWYGYLTTDRLLRYFDRG
jgi:hypothetical protein